MARVNIRDVAERAGVSTATVSHVLNQTRFVRDETRQKVLEAIEALHYHPSAIARGLATSSTQTIGLIISDIANPFFTAVVRGIEDQLNLYGYRIILCNTDEDPSREDEYLRLLFAHQVDGLIIAPTGAYSEHLVQMAEANVPIVLLDRTVPDINALLVSVDNEGGAYQATRYLIELGHRRIGILNGLETISTQRMRLDGYRRALAETGIGFDNDLVIWAGSNCEHEAGTPDSPLPEASHLANIQMTPGVFCSLRRLLDSPERPTALFVTNNQMILGTLAVLREKRLSCPDDISLVGFDDQEWAPLFTPPLTVIRQPTYQLGWNVAHLLMQLINHEEFEPPAPLAVELVVRESCRRLA